MFVSLILHEWNSSRTNYTIKDSSFQESKVIDLFTIPGYNQLYRSGLLPEFIILSTYTKRKLPVTRNLLKYYLSINPISVIRNASFWKNKLDELLPEYQYGNKYYPCIVKHLARNNIIVMA